MISINTNPAAGGRMVIPAGSEGAQKLLRVTKDGAGRTTAKEILEVSFAPPIVSH
jgi:protein-L-isoaspartate O-methyltransferase